jgi:alpha-soluble NSF attachment protein
MDKEYSAHRLVEEGNRHLNPGCMKALCSSKDKRLEDAKDCFERAANSFKLVKKWFEAGECFERCGNIEEQLKNDATKYFEEAVHCFSFEDKKSNL